MATFTNFFGAFSQSDNTDSKVDSKSGKSPVTSPAPKTEFKSGISPVTSPVPKTESKVEFKVEPTVEPTVDVQVQNEDNFDTKCDSDLKKDNEITFLNVGSHVGVNDQNVTGFFNNQSNSGLIEALKLTDLSDASRQAILKCLTGRSFSLLQKEVEEMDFATVKEFLSTNDFNHSAAKKKSKLEDMLGNMLYFHAKKNATLTSEQFEELFNLLRHQLLTPTTLGSIATLDQCKVLCESSHEFCKNLIRAYNFLAGGDKVTQSNRFPVVPQFEQKLTPVTFAELTVGDRVDVMDNCGSWYTARLLKKESDFVSKDGEGRVTFSFDGFPSSFDEVFTEEEVNEGSYVSKFGTMTNGVPHENKLDCKCTDCLKRKQQPDPIENLGDLGQLLLASVFGLGGGSLGRPFVKLF
jgi:hypothetical protein